MKWHLVKFNLDCWFAKWGAYLWVMWKVFGRRYYTSEFKMITSPYLDDPELNPNPERIIIFKRNPTPRMNEPAEPHLPNNPVTLVHWPSNAMGWSNGAPAAIPKGILFVSSRSLVGDNRLGLGQHSIELNGSVWVNELYVKESKK